MYRTLNSSLVSRRGVQANALALASYTVTSDFATILSIPRRALQSLTGRPGPVQGAAMPEVRGPELAHLRARRRHAL